MLALAQAHPDSLEQLCHCLDALAGLMAGNADVRSQCVAQGILPVVLGAMQRFSASDEVQMKGAWCLAALGAGHTQEAVDAGALRACARALENSKECSLVVAIVRAVGNLCAGPEHAAKAVALGLVPLLRRTQEENRDDPQLAYRIVVVLERLEKGSATSLPIKAAVLAESLRASGMAASMRSSAMSFVSSGSPSGGSSRFRASMRAVDLAAEQ